MFSSIDELVEAQKVNDSFEIVVFDSDNDSVNVEIIITINGQNDDPIVVLNSSYTLTEDDNDISGDLSYSDEDSYSTAIYALVTQRTGIHGDFGSLSLDSAGNWTYTLTDNLISILDVGDVTEDVFIVKVTDDQAGIGTANLVLSITGVNDVPVFVSGLTLNIDEDDISGSETIISEDDDASSGYSYSLTSDLNGDFGYVNLNSTTGYWSYIVTDNLATVLDEGDITEDRFTILVIDDQVATSAGIIIVTINGLNDAPVAVTINSELTEDDISLSGTFSSGVTDVDRSSSILSYLFETSGVYGELSNESDQWTYSITDSDIDSMVSGSVVVDTFSFRVKDDQSSWSNDSDLVITINGVNDNPVVLKTVTQSMTEDESFVTATVSSLDLDSYFTVKYSIKFDDGAYGNYVHGEFGSLTLNESTGYWKYVVTDSLVTVLDYGDETTDIFVVKATDDLGGIGTRNIIVSLNGVNDAPIIFGTFTANITEDDGSVGSYVDSSDVDESSTAFYQVKYESSFSSSQDGNMEQWLLDFLRENGRIV